MRLGNLRFICLSPSYCTCENEMLILNMRFRCVYHRSCKSIVFFLFFMQLCWLSGLVEEAFYLTENLLKVKQNIIEFLLFFYIIINLTQLQYLHSIKFYQVCFILYDRMYLISSLCTNKVFILGRFLDFRSKGHRSWLYQWIFLSEKLMSALTHA